MATFCIHETGEITTCNCFFDFWIYHVNHEKRAKFADLNDILQKVSTEDIRDYLGYYPSIFIKKRTITFEDDSPCVMITICRDCYDRFLMQMADLNNISLSEARRLNSLNPHEMYWPNNKRKKRCDYCLLNGCFSKNMDFLFVNLQAKDFVLETSIKCM